MNVLLIGGHNNFIFAAIVDKLLKENCKVYHVSDKSSARGEGISRRVVTYNIELDNEYLSVVVRSISPDVIIFMGAFDDRHIWYGDYHRASAKYVSELTNALVAASDLNVKKFIYLSTINVYGFKNSGIINEESPLAPGNVKAIIVAQGEKLCTEFSANRTLQSVILRFGTVYGGMKNADISSDYIIKKCFEAITTRKLVENNQAFPLIFVDDAIIAVYKAVSLNDESAVYNVCDDQTITDKQICDVIADEYRDAHIDRDADRSYSAQDYTIDGTKFKESHSFFQKVKYEEGIRRTARFVLENRQQLERDQRRTREEDDLQPSLKRLLNRMLPYIETVGVFLMFLGLHYFVSKLAVFNRLDIMLVYVVLISASFGTQKSLLSIVLVLLQRFFSETAGGNTFVAIVTGNDFISSILMLMMVGLIVGHVRDRLHQRLRDNANYIEHLEGEYSKLNEINDVTVLIKQELEDRMLANTDSLATVYTLVEELDSLIPADIFMRSVGVIRRILKSKSISIYLKGSDPGVFHRAFCSAGKGSLLGENFNLRYITEMNESFSRGSIFTNSQIDPALPRLASPVRIGGEIAAVVMAWDLSFEATTVYHINLFGTLIKLIEASIRRAVAFRRQVGKTIEPQNFDQYLSPGFGSCILSEEEFDALTEAAEINRAEYGMPFAVFSSKSEASEALLRSLAPMLKDKMAYICPGIRGADVIIFGTDAEPSAQRAPVRPAREKPAPVADNLVISDTAAQSKSKPAESQSAADKRLENFLRGHSL